MTELPVFMRVGKGEEHQIGTITPDVEENIGTTAIGGQEMAALLRSAADAIETGTIGADGP
jgi:hypothetical protein